MIVESVLLAPTKAILSELAKKGLKKTLDKIHPPDPSGDALGLALGLAVREYCTTADNQLISKALLGRRSILAEKEVAEQFAVALLGDAEPDAEIVARRWAAWFDQPLPDCDFEREARILIGYFRSQRRWVSDVPGPLALHELEEAVKQLAAIEAELAHFRTIIEAGFGYLPIRRIQHHRLDQFAHIAENTTGFVGRKAALGKIYQARRTNLGVDRGVVFVVADPGIGKTALLAKLTADENCVHHFNRRPAGGPTSRSKLLTNVCAQLIVKFQLDPKAYEMLPRAGEDSEVLGTLLRMVRDTGAPTPIIVVDALDEMEEGGREITFVHSLNGPAHFVMTTRPELLGNVPKELLGTAEHQRVISILPKSRQNLEDIRQYVRSRAKEHGIADYCKVHGLVLNTFVDELEARSEGNFMYLKHVLGAIASRQLKDRELRALPAGLEGYYADHMSQMSADQDAWFGYQLPVIAQLATLQHPLTPTQISAQASVPLEKVLRALNQWRYFLAPHTTRYADGRQRTAFTIYHASFQEYLRKDPVIGMFLDAALDAIDGYGTTEFGV